MTTILDEPFLERLRLGRLDRLQASMARHGVEACVLLHDPNVRYATGASAMPVWVMTTFVRCAVVPVEGTPILFDHGNSIHRSRRRAPDVRPMHVWDFFDDPVAEAAIWADETVAALRELGISGSRVATDRIAVPGFHALASRGITLRDSSPVTQEARAVKTPEELALFDLNAPMVHGMLAAVEGAIAQGVSERDVLAAMSAAMIRGGGEYLATTTLCSGPNTNPWRAEVTDRRLRAGDLVYVDTDTVGIEGCFFCVSRTWPVGEPTTTQQVTYAEARSWVEGTQALVRPGITCAELARTAPPTPERFRPQRYECMIHGIGFEEENPTVCHPQDAQSNPDTVIEPGMVLVVECYMGEAGADHGVKLGNEVVVTDDGCRTLVPYPWSEALDGDA